MKDRPSNIVVFTNQFCSISEYAVALFYRMLSVCRNVMNLLKMGKFMWSYVPQGLVQDSYRVQIFRCLNCNFIVRIENEKHRGRLI